MLEIQKFLRDDNDVELLKLPPYNLKVIEHEDGRTLFKYGVGSDFNYSICHEARGLILDRFNNWEIVCRSFDKFFNYGEEFAAKLVGDFVAYEKVDGSLVNAYWWNGDWHYGMNGTIDMKESRETKFYNAIEKFAFGRGYMSAEALCYELPRNYTHMFELVDPNLQIVLSYKETDLYYLGSRNNEDGIYKRVNNHFANYPFEYYVFSSIDEVVEYVSDDLNDGEHEGVVLVDDYGNRVKVKCPKYFELHRAANNGKPDILSIVVEHEEAEFLLYFPQYADEVKEAQHNLLFAKEKANDYRIKLSDFFHLPKKDYAKIVQEHVLTKWRTYCYKLYDNHDLTWEQYTENWNINAWRRFIE